MTGALQGGDQLKQEHLAQQYNVSISALREALKILEGEGLVVFLANHGAMITQLSAQEALDIFEIRIILETGALTRAIPKLDSGRLDRAAALLEEELACSDPSRYNQINAQFHELLYEAAANDRLLDMIHMLHNNISRYMVFYLDKMAFKEQSHAEHQKILAACRQGDKATAKRLLQQHMQKAGHALAAYLKTHEA